MYPRSRNSEGGMLPSLSNLSRRAKRTGAVMVRGHVGDEGPEAALAQLEFDLIAATQARMAEEDLMPPSLDPDELDYAMFLSPRHQRVLDFLRRIGVVFDLRPAANAVAITPDAARVFNAFLRDNDLAVGNNSTVRLVHEVDSTFFEEAGRGNGMFLESVTQVVEMM